MIATRTFVLMAALAFGLPMGLPNVAGATEGAIELRNVVEKRVVVENRDGEKVERFVPAASVVPGEIVAYTIEAKNVSDQIAERVVITDPIPEHLVYQDGSASGVGAELQFSIDGGKQFADADALEIEGPDGSTRKAEPEDYTHIRWVFAQPLAPEERATVRFLARLK